MEDEARKGFYRRPRKEFTGVVKSVSIKRMFLVMFQDNDEKYLT